MDTSNINIGTSRRNLMKAAVGGLASATALTAPALAAPVEINFWDMIWGPPEYSTTAQKLVDQYNSSQSAVKVIYRVTPWDSWYQTFVTAIASGSAPDISTGGSFQAVQFFSMGAIHPVDSLIEEMRQDGTLSEFTPATLDTVKYQGHYVALPWEIDIRALICNKTILAKNGVAPPTNWDEFRAALKKVTNNGVYGLVTSGDIDGAQCMISLAMNNGGGIFDEAGKPALNTGRTLEALEYMAALLKDGSINPASAGFSYDDSVTSFFKGEAAFFIDNPALIASASAPKADLEVLAPLKGPHGDYGTFIGPGNIMVYKQSQYIPQTMDFLKWWSKNQLPLWTQGHAGLLPVRSSLLNAPYFQNDPVQKFTIEKVVPVGRTLAAAATGTFPLLNEIDGDGFLATLTQKILQGHDPKVAADQAQTYLIGLINK